MPNGKLGDHPLTDIIVHKMRTYSELADNLILEINKLGGRKELDKINWFEHIEVSKLEKQLIEIRDRLKKDAKERGWEV